MSIALMLPALFTPIFADYSESMPVYQPPVYQQPDAALVQNLPTSILQVGSMVVFSKHPEPVPEAPDGELRRAPDGLFYVNARVNGAAILFLVDTGASVVVLTKADAARAGVSPDEEDFSAPAQTASGSSSMARVTLAHMEVGAAANSSIPAAVASDGLGVSLLGQSWLSRLQSVMIAGDRMVMR
jgi:clan AA aspartic protease (TIGR02281 family)